MCTGVSVRMPTLSSWLLIQLIHLSMRAGRATKRWSMLASGVCIAPPSVGMGTSSKFFSSKPSRQSRAALSDSLISSLGPANTATREELRRSFIVRPFPLASVNCSSPNDSSREMRHNCPDVDKIFQALRILCALGKLRSRRDDLLACFSSKRSSRRHRKTAYQGFGET